jgi:hypothetical protein
MPRHIEEEGEEEIGKVQWKFYIMRPGEASIVANGESCCR